MRTSPRWSFAALIALALAMPGAAEPLPRFPPEAVWHQDIRSAPVHPDSASMVSTWAGLGGFGFGRMQIDFSFHVVRAPAGSPTRTIIGYPSASEYYAPDCEPIGTAMPVPANAAIEGQAGLACANDAGDCHLLVVQGDRLYEAYRANASGAGGLQAQCLAVWRLERVYPASNRGEHCTSADAAGFPIAPLLFNADEVHAAMQLADGDLGHAIRFILPNARMATTLVNGSRRPVYVRPGSHAGGPSGPEGTVPYGSRLRLRADFPVSLYPPAARVVLRTMQRYGIVLADGGNVALTAESDRYTTRKWADLGITSRTFDQAVPAQPLRAQDFEVLQTGPRIVETYDCVRNADDPDPSGLSARIGRLAPGGQELAILAWTGGGAQVDLYLGASLVGTVANTGRWTGKPGQPWRQPYRVCIHDSQACSDAVYPLRDRYTRSAAGSKGKASPVRPPKRDVVPP